MQSVVVWVVVIGAACAADVMARFRLGRAVGYRRLRALVDQGLLARARLLHGQPALYIATRDRLAWVGYRVPQLEPAHTASRGSGRRRRVTRPDGRATC